MRNKKGEELNNKIPSQLFFSKKYNPLCVENKKSIQNKNSIENMVYIEPTLFHLFETSCNLPKR